MEKQEKFTITFRDGSFETFYAQDCQRIASANCWQIIHEGELCVTIPQDVIKFIKAEIEKQTFERDEKECDDNALDRC